MGDDAAVAARDGTGASGVTRPRTLVGAAVCVGVSRYRTDDGQPISDLPAAWIDAGRIRGALAPLCPDPVLLPATADGQVTAAEVLAAVEAACARARDCKLDAFYFFFAGHGVSVRGERDDETIVLLLLGDGSLLALDKIIDAAKDGPAAQYFFADACRTLTDPEHVYIRTDGGLARKTQRYVHRLYATADGRVARGRQGGGTFSGVLERALCGDGPQLSHSVEGGWQLTFGNLCAFVHGRMLEESREQIAADTTQLPQWWPPVPSAAPVMSFGAVEQLTCRVRMNVRADAPATLAVKLRRLALEPRLFDVAPGKSEQSLPRGEYEVVTVAAGAGDPRPAGARFSIWTATAAVTIRIAHDGRADVTARGSGGEATETLAPADAEAWSTWRVDPIPAAQASGALGRVQAWGGRWCSLAIAAAPGCAAIPRAIWPHFRRVQFPDAAATDGGDAGPRGRRAAPPPRQRVIAQDGEVVLVRHEVAGVTPLRRISHAPPRVDAEVYVLGLALDAGPDAPAVQQRWGTIESVAADELVYRSATPIPSGYLGAGVFDARTGALVGMQLDVIGDHRRRVAGSWSHVWRSTWLRG